MDITLVSTCGARMIKTCSVKEKPFIKYLPGWRSSIWKLELSIFVSVLSHFSIVAIQQYCKPIDVSRLLASETT